MTIQLLVSDLDGTLLQRGQSGHSGISLADRSALHEASAKGLTICLASGRLYPDIKATTLLLELPCHAISQNGTATYLHGGELLHSSGFALDLAHALIRFPDGTPFARSVSCANESVYVEAHYPDHSDVRQRVNSPFIIHPDLASAFGNELQPTKFCYYGKLASLQALQRAFENAFGEQIEALMTDVDCLDIMPAGISKGAGLRILLERLGIAPDEVACVGDQFNDVSMFAVTPHSFAMSHGPEAVRAQAAHVVDTVHDVVHWILRYNQGERSP